MTQSSPRGALDLSPNALTVLEKRYLVKDDAGKLMVGFFEPGSEFVTIRAGMFAIFGPEDVHSPCHVAGQPGLVRKVVVKAAVDGPSSAP